MFCLAPALAAAGDDSGSAGKASLSAEPGSPAHTRAVGHGLRGLRTAPGSSWTSYLLCATGCATPGQDTRSRNQSRRGGGVQARGGAAPTRLGVAVLLRVLALMLGLGPDAAGPGPTSTA